MSYYHYLFKAFLFILMSMSCNVSAQIYNFDTNDFKTNDIYKITVDTSSKMINVIKDGTSVFNATYMQAKALDGGIAFTFRQGEEPSLLPSRESLYFCIRPNSIGFFRNKTDGLKGSSPSNPKTYMSTYNSLINNLKGTNAKTVAETKYTNDTPIEELKKGAESGNMKAQSILGELYYLGEKVDRNYTEAAKYFKMAADQGDIDSQNNLGVCYLNGQGVKQDVAAAFQWFKKSADAGCNDAQSNLGVCYLNGHGVKPDVSVALQLFRKAADGGSSMAQHNLGYCYETGFGVSKDIDEAIKWYLKAAEQDYVGSQMNLGACYQAKQMAQEALKWYKKAAESGNRVAQHNVGVFYFEGRGVEQDLNEARKWFEKAANNGYQGSQEILNKHFYNK